MKNVKNINGIKKRETLTLLEVRIIESLNRQLENALGMAHTSNIETRDLAETLEEDEAIVKAVIESLEEREILTTWDDDDGATVIGFMGQDTMEFEEPKVIDATGLTKRGKKGRETIYRNHHNYSVDTVLAVIGKDTLRTLYLDSRPEIVEEPTPADATAAVSATVTTTTKNKKDKKDGKKGKKDKKDGKKGKKDKASNSEGSNLGKTYKKSGDRHESYEIAGKKFKQGASINFPYKGGDVIGEFRNVNFNDHSPKGYAVIKIEEDGKTKLIERALPKLNEYIKELRKSKKGGKKNKK